jgi:hypothetical protein
MIKKVVVVFKARTEHQETDKILETVLQSSFPKAVDIEKFIQLFKQVLIDKKICLNGHNVNSKIHFYFPIFVILD